MITITEADLKAPFPPEKISWRVGSTTQDKTKGMALAYIDARDVMERLDAVCAQYWQAEYVPMPNSSCCCRIGIKIGEEWIWRSNGALNITDSEKPDAREMAEKGSYSDAFKRAAVLWGIGRYLYDLDSPWVKLKPVGKSFAIDDSELPRLRKLLTAPKTVSPPLSPESITGGEWPVMVPNIAGVLEYTRCATADVWVEQVNELAATVTNSAKLTDVQKEAKLRALREANVAILDRVPEEAARKLAI